MTHFTPAKVMDLFHVFTFPPFSLSLVPESVINAAFYTLLSTDVR